MNTLTKVIIFSGVTIGVLGVSYWAISQYKEKLFIYAIQKQMNVR